MTVSVLVTLLVAIAILSFCSALFSRVETALFLLKPHQLRRLEKNHPGLTKFIQLFRENPRRVLNVLLLGDGLVNVLLVVLCLFFLWEGPLAGRVPQWLAAILIFAMVVLLCDLVPKLVALAAPSKLSAIGAFTLQIAMPFLDRIGRVLETVSEYVLDRLTPAHLRSRPRLSDEELGTLLQIGEEEGALYHGEADMIQEIIRLGDKTAKIAIPTSHCGMRPASGPCHKKTRHNTTSRTFTNPSPSNRTFRTRRGLSWNSCMNFVSPA